LVKKGIGRWRGVVDTFVPNREIGWSVATPGFRVHHAWVLIPERNGTCLVTEETPNGAAAFKFRREQPNVMFDGHDWWASALKARAERGDRSLLRHCPPN